MQPVQKLQHQISQLIRLDQKVHQSLECFKNQFFYLHELGISVTQREGYYWVFDANDTEIKLPLAVIEAYEHYLKTLQAEMAHQYQRSHERLNAINTLLVEGVDHD